ncbi:hypothetical protein PF008_g4680 [Phytophthora fragariae]|uniref:Uncharacterized protein n=1 Tax=Phytophthora fragariae TaxID=53985 RepID=A0A6G0SAQ8_9STRA|nr:hypothetical protein PF008_g4680 [Phytophthora fragariae]
MALQEYNACLLTGVVLPKRDRISLGDGIHGSRTGSVRDVTAADGVELPSSPPRGVDSGPASASGLSLPLRERFEREARSRGRRVPTVASSRPEDDDSLTSSPSSMSASSMPSKRVSLAKVTLPRDFWYSPTEMVRLGELDVVTVEVTTDAEEAEDVAVVAVLATTAPAAAGASGVSEVCVTGVLISK